MCSFIQGSPFGYCTGYCLDTVRILSGYCGKPETRHLAPKCPNAFSLRTRNEKYLHAFSLRIRTAAAQPLARLFASDPRWYPNIPQRTIYPHDLSMGTVCICMLYETFVWVKYIERTVFYLPENNITPWQNDPQQLRFLTLRDFWIHSFECISLGMSFQYPPRPKNKACQGSSATV